MRLITHDRLREIGGPPELNMAPLIDMVFILLIFFLVTTTFVKETGVPIDRPSAATAEQLDSQTIVVAIDASGGIHMQGRPVTLIELRALLRQELVATPARPVVVLADRASRHATLVDVLDEARLAGAPTIQIATERE
jgi:biopolymer transport protein ExbD